MNRTRTIANFACVSSLALACAGQALGQSSTSGTGSQTGSTSSSQTGMSGSRTGMSGSQTGMSGSQTTTGSSRTGSGAQTGTSTGSASSMGRSSQSGMGGSSQNAMASAADKKFVMKAMQGGMAEVQMGQLASQKASSPEVKEFGQKMVDDHTKLNEQMKPVAAQLGIAEPTTLSAKHQALMAKMQGLSGAEFDKAYVTAMVADHKEDEKDFKSEETGAKNSQVRDAATQGEPVIAQHLQMAEDLQKKVK